MWRPVLDARPRRVRGDRGRQPPAAGSADPTAARPGPAGDVGATGDAGAGERGRAAQDLRRGENANESFARSIIQTAINKELAYVKALCESQDTIKAHQDAVHHIEKNERHVIAAYARCG